MTKLLIKRADKHYILCDNSNVKSKEFVMYLPTLSINCVEPSEVNYYNSKENKEYYKRIIGYGGEPINVEAYIKIIPMDKIKDIIKTKPHSYIEEDINHPIWEFNF